MKQVLRKGLKEIVVDEVPDPVLVPHHVLIRPHFSLISSGTETASIHNESVIKSVADNPSHLATIWKAVRNQGPLRALREVQAKFKELAVLGYSGAGILVDKHSTVTDLEIGDRVAYGGEGTGHGETVLAGRNLVVKLPDAVAFEHACFATLGSIALNAVRIAEIGLGEKVAVIGLGLLGQLVAQLVRLQGGQVMGIDLRSERLELAKKLGVDSTADPSSAAVVASAFTEGRGLDCVMIAAAAKSSGPCEQAVDTCRDRGRIVDVGAVELSFPWGTMYRKELKLLMARAYGPGSYDPQYEKQGRDYPHAYVRWTENRNMEEFLRLVGSRHISLDPLITHRFALEDAARAYETIMDASSGSLAVVLRYPESETETPRTFAPKRRVPITPQKEIAGEISVALVGAGNLSRWVHLPILRKLSGVRLRAVCSTHTARSKSYALRFGSEYCSTDYNEILSDPKVHAVVLVTRNKHHFQQAMDALRAGKHVFVEKPMALTEQECRQLSEAVEQTGKQLTVGFNRRFVPFYQQIKLELGRRSGPAVLNCRINSPGISGNYWMADPKEGGAILGEACHFTDLMYWLLESEPVTVSAYSLPNEKDIIGENNIAATFRFSDGSIGNLTYCTVGSATSAGERLEAFAPGVGANTENFKRLTMQKKLSHSRSLWYAEKGYRAQMQSFFDRLRKGLPPEVTVDDGSRATICCLRMLSSARELLPFTIDWQANEWQPNDAYSSHSQSGAGRGEQ
ncbi:MAG TPA: bi-domain-containing oxidoreductase [Terriglobales bacterium]|nr:bi-domain-containing oxidoreductase [Terriglobales bacterium]